MDDLPKLPPAACWMTGESAWRLIKGGNAKGAVPVHLVPGKTANRPRYTEQQMRAYALEAVAAYKADAERYRWLRDNNAGDWIIATYDEDWGYSWFNMEPAEIDAAIDEAGSAP